MPTELSFSGTQLRIGRQSITAPWSIMDAFDDGSRVVALLNPDDYLTDPSYRLNRRSGAPAIRNLVAYSYQCTLLWQADLPSEVDYYYRILSKTPLRVGSFSSFVCQIDPANGKIVEKTLYK